MSKHLIKDRITLKESIPIIESVIEHLQKYTKSELRNNAQNEIKRKLGENNKMKTELRGCHNRWKVVFPS